MGSSRGPRRTVQRICATFPKGDCPFAFQIVYNIQYTKIVFFCQEPAAKLLQLLPHPLFWDRVPRSFQIQGSPSTAVRYSMRSRAQKNGSLRTSMRLFLYNCSRSERLRSSKKPALDRQAFIVAQQQKRIPSGKSGLEYPACQGLSSALSAQSCSSNWYPMISIIMYSCASCISVSAVFPKFSIASHSASTVEMLSS